MVNSRFLNLLTVTVKLFNKLIYSVFQVNILKTCCFKFNIRTVISECAFTKKVGCTLLPTCACMPARAKVLIVSSLTVQRQSVSWPSMYKHTELNTVVYWVRSGMHGAPPTTGSTGRQSRALQPYRLYVPKTYIAFTTDSLLWLNITLSIICKTYYITVQYVHVVQKYWTRGIEFSYIN